MHVRNNECLWLQRARQHILMTGFLTRVYYRLIDLHMHFVWGTFQRLPLVCSSSAGKIKKPLCAGKQNTGLKMREKLIVRFLSSGLAHEQKHTDTSHCCWQPVQVHSLLSWSWQKQRERNAGGNAEMLAMLKPTLSNFSYLPGHLLCTNETVISHFSAFKRELFL